MKTFEEAWKATGYQYGKDELEGVKLGWELCTKEADKQRLLNRVQELERKLSQPRSYQLDIT